MRYGTLRGLLAGMAVAGCALAPGAPEPSLADLPQHVQGDGVTAHWRLERDEHRALDAQGRVVARQATRVDWGFTARRTTPFGVELPATDPAARFELAIIHSTRRNLY